MKSFKYKPFKGFEQLFYCPFLNYFPKCTTGITNVSYSSGPPTTAATGGCTCHGPSSNNTNVSILFNGGGSMYYTNGQTYPITITVSSSTNMPAAGFALQTNIGTFGTPPVGTQLISSDVWEHSTPQFTIGSLPSIATWTINWTAPLTGNTPLTINAAGNAVDLSSDNSGDEWNFAALANIPLPVNIINFNTSRINNKTIITWSTSEEKNLKKYQIESSVDGKTFNSIGIVDAQNSNEYEYIDDKNYNSNSILYRLKLIDIDNLFVYSSVNSVRNNNNSMSIFPNIIHENESINVINIDFENNDELILFNSFGQQVKKQILHSANEKISLSSIPLGTYFVFINNHQSVNFIDKLSIQ